MRMVRREVVLCNQGVRCFLSTECNLLTTYRTVHAHHTDTPHGRVSDRDRAEHRRSRILCPHLVPGNFRRQGARCHLGAIQRFVQSAQGHAARATLPGRALPGNQTGALYAGRGIRRDRGSAARTRRRATDGSASNSPRRIIGQSMFPPDLPTGSKRSRPTPSCSIRFRSSIDPTCPVAYAGTMRPWPLRGPPARIA